MTRLGWPVVLVVGVLVLASAVSSLAGGSDALQSPPRIEVEAAASSSITAVYLEGETIRDDPDVMAGRSDVDGITHAASGMWLTVEVEITAPYSGSFFACTYPWVTNALTTPQCEEGDYYTAGERQYRTFDVYVDPVYSGGQYWYVVDLGQWVWNGYNYGYQGVDRVWFTVAVDRETATDTPRETPTVTFEPPTTTAEPPTTTTEPPTTMAEPPTTTAEPPTTTAEPSTATPDPRTTDSPAGPDGGDGEPEDPNDVDRAGVAGGEDPRDRGDLFSPENVALMMLVLAAASLLVQLTRGG